MTRIKFTLVLTISVASIVLAAADAQAIMLGAYDFENATGLVSVDSDLNSTAGPMISGSGMSLGNNITRGENNVPAYVAGTNDQSMGFSQEDTSTGNAAAARAAGDYFLLTLDANTGFSLNLEDLTFRTALSNSAGVNRTWTLDYALNGGSFVNDFATGDFTGPLTTSSYTGLWTPFTVDFSDPQFDLIDSITLRFVQHGTFTSLHAVLYDKIALKGVTEVVPIPEPSSALLLALGLLIPALRRRKR